MNFEHVCVKVLLAVIVCGVCFGCIAFAEHYDNFVPALSRKKLYITICMISSAVTCVIKDNVWQSMGMEIVLGALLFACITDYTQCQVYHFTWWIAGSVVMGWLFVAICRGEPIPWLELILFCMLQELLFAKLYGRADCHAFCVCAVMYALLEKGMLCYLLHMWIAFLLLAGIQWHQGNIAGNGNLKKPVPLIPYIVLTFLLLYVATTCEIFLLNKYSHLT